MVLNYFRILAFVSTEFFHPHRFRQIWRDGHVGPYKVRAPESYASAEWIRIIKSWSKLRKKNSVEGGLFCYFKNRIWYKIRQLEVIFYKIRQPYWSFWIL